ncbi:MAG: NUDIX hydrolase [Dactylosporangium sp.]|nr:NUDIX hydrolase [Dactylosporangium sp.]NNJ61008.1 NUDIX hydrolase [Dactylosporangium sp.]
MPGGAAAARDYLLHPGAVGVVALDDADRVALVYQYRHPIGRRLWELPAGLIDVEGERLIDAAARELAEEVDLRAERWDLLTDVHVSPGCSTEMIRLYLARGLTPVPEEVRHHRVGEEADMGQRMVDLDEAVGMALSGAITNAACLVGVLATARSRASGWSTLRSVDEPFGRS